MKRIRTGALILAVCLLLSACGVLQENASVSDTAFLLDTTVTITIYGTRSTDLLDECFDEIRRLENLLSTAVEGSDIQRINDAAGGAFITVSSETLHVLKRAQEISALTGGAFDITVGPLVNLWNIRGSTGTVPDEAQISAAQSLVGYENLEISGNSVRLARAGMCIDLGAIAKGYIGQQIRELLLREGAEHALIDLGGNILAVGGHTDGSPFRIGIQDPFRPTGTACAAVSAADTCVVTAGDYERYFESGGVRYHHILDPETGAPARSGLSGVTIVASDCELADALSTAVFILGAEDGLPLIESLEGIECVLIADDGTVTVSSGLEDLFELLS